MRPGIIGQEGFIDSRRAMLSAIKKSAPAQLSDVKVLSWPSGGHPLPERIEAFFQDIDLLMLAVPPEHMYSVTEQALRSGLHVYMNWSTVFSLSELEALACLAEEAGAELGVDLPLFFHPVFDVLPAKRANAILSIQHHIDPDDARSFQHALDEAIEMCYHFANTGDVRRIDAHMVKGMGFVQEHLLAGIRFQNSCYAHIQVSRAKKSTHYTLHASGSGFNIEVDLNKGILIQQSTAEQENANTLSAFEAVSLNADNLEERALKAFIEALHSGKPAPTSILDGLHTRRITEKLRTCLR